MTVRRTFRGNGVDIDALVNENGDSIAVGNAGTNARGDKLGPGGVITQTAEEMARQRSRTVTSVTSSGVKGDQPSASGMGMDALRTSRKKTDAASAASTTTVRTETHLDNGDIVVDDGEFGAPNAD